MPPCGLGDGADDREAEPEGAAAVAGAAHEALEQRRRAARAARRGRRPRRPARAWPSAAMPVRHADLGARRRVAQGVLEQVDREAVQLVARALDDRGLDVERDLVLAADRPELAGRLDDDLRQVARLARGRRGRRRCAPAAAGRRPAGACAGRSAAPSAPPRPGRRAAIRRAARGWRARSSAACAARARRRRRTGAGGRASTRSRRARRRARGASPRACARARRPRRRPAAGARRARDRACARSRPRSMVSSRDRRHRAARDRHAGEQRQRGAGEHAEQQEQLDARDRRLGVRDAAAVLDDHAADRLAAAAERDRGWTAEHAVAVDGLRGSAAARPSDGAFAGFLRDQLCRRARGS